MAIEQTPLEERQRAYETAQHVLDKAKKRVVSLQSSLDSARNAVDRVRYADQLRYAQQEKAAAQSSLNTAITNLEESGDISTR